MHLLASSSVVFPKSMERWSVSPQNSGSSLHQPLNSRCCFSVLASSPTKITEGLTKYMQFVSVSHFSSEMILTFSARSREGNGDTEDNFSWFTVSTEMRSEETNSFVRKEEI